GRDALAAWEASGRNWRFATLRVDGIKDADARGNEPISLNGELVGRATSGGYGWRTGQSIALAMVRPPLAEVGTELTIRILGDDYKATVIPESPFDAENQRLRA
ncbi:MAG: glycine cleavage T C-terminal barrel domain-containing protein, partial [Pseudomonadota bacterium]